jgi:hypothetical protein
VNLEKRRCRGCSAAGQIIKLEMHPGVDDGSALGKRTEHLIKQNIVLNIEEMYFQVNRRRETYLKKL